MSSPPLPPTLSQWPFLTPPHNPHQQSGQHLFRKWRMAGIGCMAKSSAQRISTIVIGSYQIIHTSLVLKLTTSMMTPVSRCPVTRENPTLCLLVAVRESELAISSSTSVSLAERRKREPTGLTRWWTLSSGFGLAPKRQVPFLRILKKPNAKARI